MNIPMVDLKGQYESLRHEIDDAILQSLSETRFILGPIAAKTCALSFSDGGGR